MSYDLQAEGLKGMNIQRLIIAGHDWFRATGAVLAVPYILAQKAEALYLANRTSEAARLISAFAGCWNKMTFSIWGRSVELLIDPLTLALNNQVRIFANLSCDVGVRYPAAFAVTAPVTLEENFPAGLALALRDC